MTKLLLSLALVFLASAGSGAEGAKLSWAYPAEPPGLKQPAATQRFTAEGTKTGLELTMKQINNPFGPPDWFPDEHAPMPVVVKNGRAPHVDACMLCHLANGNGHPESASISGLTAHYIVEQVHAFRDGNRSSIWMNGIARNITEPELAEAAAYFAAVPKAQQQWIKITESRTAPATHFGEGGKRFLNPGTATVRIAPTTIHEIGVDEKAADLRDQHGSFVAYVPMGSIRQGRLLATTGGGKTLQCALCHGANLEGAGDVPRLAGRGPSYLTRQLADMRSGARKGPGVAIMKPVVKRLSDQDIVNLVAYISSLEP